MEPVLERGGFRWGEMCDSPSLVVKFLVNKKIQQPARAVHDRGPGVDQYASHHHFAVYI